MNLTEKQLSNFPVPLQRSVVIKKIKLVLEGQIIMPDTAKSATSEGTIMAVADELLGFVQVGQRVVYNNNAHLWVHYEGEDYILAHETDVYAKVEEVNGAEILFPFNKTVLVRQGQDEVKLASGLYLPDASKANFINYGYVIGVGENVNKQIQVGNKVVFNYYADFCFIFRSQKIMCMAEADVFAILPMDSFVSTSPIKVRRPDIPLDQLPN